MRRLLYIMLLVGLVAGCTPADIDYCQSVNTPPAQLAQCTRDYHQQDEAFKADLAVCSAKADETYPPTLYSGWGTALVHGMPYGGRFGNIEEIETPPDAQKNAQLDALRMRIIEPCMQSHGWNSGHSWQDGRRL